MSEFAGFDLDRSTARAWSAFRSRLADRVAELEDDDLVFLEVESAVDEDEREGSAPYVQFCAWGGTMVRAEVSGNAYLAGEHRLDDRRSAQLEELGWHGPDGEGGSGSANFHLDLDRNHADRLAVMTVRALRDVFGVAHPAFLCSDDLLGSDQVGDEGPGDEGPGHDDHAAGPGDDEPLSVVPDDRDHLKELVDRALVPVFGHLPEHDEDDDVPVVDGTGLVWVRVLEDAPVVHLFSALVCDVGDPERAAFEVAVLNRDVRLMKFVLVEDTVMAHLYLPALPFAPLHLRAMLRLMSTTVDRVDDDLVARIGGRRAFEPVEPLTDDELDTMLDAAAAEASTSDEDVPLHPAMSTILQLEDDAPGSVDPALAADICDLDRDLVLELIGQQSGLETGWRERYEQVLLTGDGDEEAAACRGRMDRAARMTNLLRRALRVVVERQAGRRSQDGGYGVDRRRTGRAAARDQALPGLDDAEQGLWEQ